MKKSIGCFRIDYLPSKYFRFQLAYIDFGQKFIICFVSYLRVRRIFFSYHSKHVLWWRNQNIQMDVVDIWLVYSNVVNIVGESLIKTRSKLTIIVTYCYMILQHVEFYFHHITRISLDNAGNHNRHYYINRLMCLKFSISHIL